MSNLSALVEEAVSVPGPLGRLEAVLAYPADSEPTRAVLIVGPHPMLGGDFENNVVREMAQRLVEADAVTLRFNYRGIGRSDGPRMISTDNIAQFMKTSRLDDELRMRDDVAACANYLAEQTGKIDLLVGYSFGAWLGSLWLAEQGSATSHLVLLAPTVAQHDYDHLLQLPAKKFVIASEDDFATPRSDLETQFQRWGEPKQIRFEKMDNHFFRGYEEQVARWIRDFWLEEGLSASCEH